MAEYPSELEADMRQVYGVDVWEVGEGMRLGHAACLAAQLPADSRTFERIRREPRAPMSGLCNEDYMAALSAPRKAVEDGD